MFWENHSEQQRKISYSCFDEIFLKKSFKSKTKLQKDKKELNFFFF